MEERIWLVGLTTPDSLYIFPVLTPLTFWITVECNMQEGMEGNPMAGTMKNVLRGLVVATVPLTVGFAKAIFCYWVTTNLFSLGYGFGETIQVLICSIFLSWPEMVISLPFFSVLKAPGVRRFLGVPDIPVPNPSDAPQPAFSLLSSERSDGNYRDCFTCRTIKG